MIIDSYSDKTKAIFLAHTLGNPLEIEKLKDFCDEKNLWLIEETVTPWGQDIMVN